MIGVLGKSNFLGRSSFFGTSSFLGRSKFFGMSSFFGRSKFFGGSTVFGNVFGTVGSIGVLSRIFGKFGFLSTVLGMFGKGLTLGFVTGPFFVSSVVDGGSLGLSVVFGSPTLGGTEIPVLGIVVPVVADVESFWFSAGSLNVVFTGLNVLGVPGVVARAVEPSFFLPKR